MWVLKYDRNHFGRHGFNKAPETIKRHRIINIWEINKNIETWLSEGKIKKDGDTYIIDLRQLGYDKLLGTGTPAGKYKITVDHVSEKARERIEEVGGEVLAE